MKPQIKELENNSLDIELYHILFDLIDQECCVIEMKIQPDEPLDFKFIELNKAFEMHSTLFEAKGKRMRELLPNLEEYWFETYRDVALTGKPIRFENRVKELQDRLFSIYAFRFGKPALHRVALLFTDITQRNLAKEFDNSLRLSEERLRLAFNAVNFGTWEIDLQSGFAFHNLRHDQIFGYKELQTEWTLDKTLYHVVPEAREMVRQAFEEATVQGGLSVETQIRWEDGSLHWIFLHGQVYSDKEGKPGRIIGIIADITQSKEKEHALIDSESRLKELNATKDKFFSIIAHDLKSPYNSILGFSEMLIEKLKGKDYNEIETYAAIIQKSAWRALNLLTNLFIWTKLQTGRIEFHPEEKDIISLINESIELLVETALLKSITIYEFTPDSFHVMIDENMISTVLRNLLSNAIKFTNTNGNITISFIPKENELEISVADNGMGLDQDKIEKLFRIDEPFTTPGTEGEEGSGLGLVLCHEFVNKHGGRIWAESEIGRGCNFIFTLPISHSEMNVSFENKVFKPHE